MAAVGVLKPGDVVRLKSGGPLMTVEKFTSDNYVKVSWFEGTDLKGGVLPDVTLEKVRD